MNIDPQQIIDDVDAVLADVSGDAVIDTGDPAVREPEVDGALGPAAGGDLEHSDDIDAIDALGRRLEEAHQILVDALESVEKG